MRWQIGARTLRGAALTVALLTLVPACRGKRDKPVFPVFGQVYVKKQPASNALVILTPTTDADPEQWPKGYPRGTVQEDGSFQITTNQTGDGAPAGDYVVTIMWLAPVPGRRESEYDKLAGRYADLKTSKLRVHVEADRQGNIIDPFYLD